MCEWDWNTEFVKAFVKEMKCRKFSPWCTAQKLVDALIGLDKIEDELKE